MQHSMMHICRCCFGMMTSEQHQYAYSRVNKLLPAFMITRHLHIRKESDQSLLYYSLANADAVTHNSL